tara:strand:+ start:1066 stop:1566 length:501 start_codon:yes stop_codon:yes gene_type:complete
VSFDVPRLKNIRTYGMFKTIIKAMYSTFISIVLISIILASWTTYSFVFQSSKSIEIAKVIKDMYASQKSVVIDVINLSKILIKDTSGEIAKDNKTSSKVTNLPAYIEEDSQLDKSPIVEDNGENPLGIIIEPSLPEVSENTLPEMIDEPLVKEQNEFSISQMEMNF